MLIRLDATTGAALDTDELFYCARDTCKRTAFTRAMRRSDLSPTAGSLIACTATVCVCIGQLES